MEIPTINQIKEMEKKCYYQDGRVKCEICECYVIRHNFSTHCKSVKHRKNVFSHDNIITKIMRLVEKDQKRNLTTEETQVYDGMRNVLTSTNKNTMLIE